MHVDIYDLICVCELEAVAAHGAIEPPLPMSVQLQIDICPHVHVNAYMRAKIHLYIAKRIFSQQSRLRFRVQVGSGSKGLKPDVRKLAKEQ